jgi:YidC/Oxa1 family membrane protein insertase
MMKMGKMGPEMERLKKKYGDDKDAMSKAQMQLMKEQGMTPVYGCLPMFLQMPIWIALWSSLQSTFELRHAGFLHFGGIPLTWIHDLAKPDELISLSHAISLPFGAHLKALNILPILLGVVFFLQQKYTPKPAASTPEQIQQQKMMMWMSTLLFPLFLYNGPSGLNLYILTSTTIGIIEGKIIRKHIKEREEAEKAGKVFIETKPTRNQRNRDKDQPAPEKKGKALSWLESKLEQLQQEAKKRGKDKA